MSVRGDRRKNITIVRKPVKENWRFWSFVGIVFFVFLVIIGRLFQIQILEYDIYKARADKKHQGKFTLVGDRGNIYFQNLKSGTDFPVAINLITYDIGIDASLLSQNESNKVQIKEFIEQNFPDIDKAKLEEEFNKTDNKYYIFVKDVPEATVNPIKDKKLRGLILEKKSTRYYPEKTLGSQVLGFVSKNDNTGQYGVEKYYEDILRGEDGYANVEAKDRRGVWLLNTSIDKKDAVNGSNIVLTIDHTLQFKLEEVLAKLAQEYKTKVALGAIMDPKTGDILAMASNPTFDINEYNKVSDPKVYQNPLVSSRYDQGSIFKPITVGIGLDKGVITPNTTYDDKGKEIINASEISNWSNKTYGIQSMSYALENSLNLGMIFIQRKLGRDAFAAGIIDQFQIGNKTGIDLPGEVNNDISNLRKSAKDARDIEYANISFGQSIPMTPIRMLTSFNSIVNEGKIVKPRIVKSIQSPDGDIKTFEPEIQGQSMSAESARQLSEMLVDVVEKGSAKPAAVEGYSIGGKTGTGQILVNGKYIKNGGPTYQSFIEFATLDNPKYTLLISLDTPQGSRFADGSVVPKMKEFNEFLLNYFAIPPDK
jgi:stage V sporulation protein D (sporulation-specific penicillin-binding protein)